MQITFLGATQTVTGSKYLVEHQHYKVLVDCGLFQGRKELRLRNWAPFPVSPASIHALILTHAHIDHSGYIPLLVKRGFRGKIYCSEATYDLCDILLRDSGFLQEEDARRANRYGYTRHHPALPLYTEEDAKASLRYFHPISFGKPYEVAEGLAITLSRAGHILGSACVTVSDGSRNVVFSGDLGRSNHPIMQSPAILQDADYLVVESTYGDRLHASIDPCATLGQVVRETLARGGSLLIPAFAVGRAQQILYYLYQLKKQRAIPNVPVFLDSPMAINVTSVLHKYKHEHRLSPEECIRVCELPTYVRTVDESRHLNNLSIPAVIISASGMATGGRVLHHLVHMMGDKKHTILFAGFQAPGTRGDRIVHHEPEIKIHGMMYPLRARVMNLENVSAHADYEEMLSWLRHFRTAPKKVFVTHGEHDAAVSMANKIQQQLGWDAIVPSYMQSERFS